MDWTSIAFVSLGAALWCCAFIWIDGRRERRREAGLDVACVRQINEIVQLSETRDNPLASPEKRCEAGLRLMQIVEAQATKISRKGRNPF